jgi:NAD(P)-dependent dehydrogenase (short-subunit alcohol dehydrogenase family)
VRDREDALEAALDFTGRVVLITGGTKGIGRSIAQRFEDAGASVVVCGRNEPEGAASGRFIACDVRDPEQVGAMVDDISRREGITLLNLSPPFHQHAKAGEQLIYAIDSHWNPAGHRVAAAALLASPIFQPLRDAGAGVPRDPGLTGGRR